MKVRCPIKRNHDTDSSPPDCPTKTLKAEELLWETASVDEWPPSLKTFKGGEYCQVPHLDLAGLIPVQSKQTSKKLFWRSESIRQLEFLDKCEKLDPATHKRQCLGVVIQGAPGAGKSCTTWAWLLQRVATQSVLWVHATNDLYNCVRMTLTGVETCVSSYKHQIMKLLVDADEEIVVFDGLIGSNSNHSELVASLQSRLVKSGTPRRFTIQVASLAFTTSNSLINGYKYLSIERLDVYPWTLAEYTQACKDPDLLKSVSSFLDVGDDKDLDQLLANKFDYAGASARWMFATSIPDIITQVREAIQMADNLDDIFKMNNGEKSKSVANVLTMSYSDGKRFFVSRLVATMIAQFDKYRERDSFFKSRLDKFK